MGGQPGGMQPMHQLPAPMHRPEHQTLPQKMDALRNAMIQFRLQELLSRISGKGNKRPSFPPSFGGIHGPVLPGEFGDGGRSLTRVLPDGTVVY
jgi:hypothetical protein